MRPVTNYTDAELEAMLADLESDIVERKEAWAGDAHEKAREAVCAFANDLPDRRRAGIVFVGARDDGTPSGIAVTDALLRTLADMKTDGNITPPPTLFVAKRTLKGTDMAVVSVEPADAPPVRYKGRIHVRFGPRRAIATAQDERILNEKRRHGDRPFDVSPVRAATLADLDRRLFETTYLPAAVAADVLAANDRTFEQRLAATKMILSVEEPVPTLLGVLVLAPRARDFAPGAYIQFLRVEGTTLADPVKDELPIDGTMTDVLSGIDEKLKAHNRTAVEIATVSLERRTPTYPLAALQQLIRNAIMHRAYEGTHAPVRVTWYDDRVEINSPGGPFGVVTAANFGVPGVADYRNPDLAEALRVLGYVQRFGVGIALARRELDTNGNRPPEFHVEPTYVGVTVRSA